MSVYRISYFLILSLLFFIVSCDNKIIHNDVTLKRSSYYYSNYDIKFSLNQVGDSYVSYWSEGSTDKLKSKVSKSKKNHTIPLTIIEPSVKYNFVIHSSSNNLSYTSKLFSFTSSEIPYEFPSFEIEKNNNYDFDGYILLRTQNTPWTQLLINSDGIPLWYGISDSVLSRPFNIVDKKSYLSLSKPNLIEEVTFEGDTLVSINTMKNIIHHDILKHNDKFIGLTYKYFDVEDNLDLDTLKGDGIVVYDSLGKLFWEWNIFDVINPMDKGNEYYLTKDWSHANGIFVDYDENYLISFRAFGQIWKINSSTGDIIWRLGMNGDFDLSKSEIFYAQHAINKIDNDTYILFDNGDVELRKSSRALIFKLDEANNDFQIEKSVFLPDDLFSFKQGSVYLFDQNKLLFASSVNSKIVITDMDGEVLWNLNSDYSFYRAYYLNEIL
jgi:hypothetical protein